MTKASDNDFPSLLLTEQGSAPTTPAASHQRMYIRTSDHTLVTVNSSGTVTPVASGGAGTFTTIKDEGSNLSTAVVSLDFVGGGVTATGTTAVVATIPSPGVSTKYQSVNRTAGNITLAANTTTHTEVSSALRLTLAAATGDVLMIGISSLLTQGGSGEAEIDSATIVSSAIVNQCTPGTKAIGHGYTTTALESIGATLTYVVQSGDISGGNVTVSPTFRNTDAASTGLLRASTDYALRYWVLNLGH